MLARPVTNGNVFVFGMKDTAEIECEQANGNLWPEFFHWTCLIWDFLWRSVLLGFPDCWISLNGRLIFVWDRIFGSEFVFGIAAWMILRRGTDFNFVSVWEAIKPGALWVASFEISSLAMAENPELHPETREPETPEVAGPVNVPELPPSGNVDVATINVATDAFINGMAQAVLEEEDPRMKRNFQMWTVMGKLVTSNARLLSHHLVQVNEKLDVLGEWLRKDCESGQSCFEETRVTMADFSKKFDHLSESIKFLTATTKTSAHEEAEVKKKMMSELSSSRELISHIRSNTIILARPIRRLVIFFGK